MPHCPYKGTYSHPLNMSHCSSYAHKTTLADSHTTEVLITAPDLIAAIVMENLPSMLISGSVVPLSVEGLRVQR